MFWSLSKTIIFLKINLLENQHFQKQFLFLALFLGVWTAKKQSKMSAPDSKQNSKFGKAVISGCIIFVFLACTDRKDGRECTKELKSTAILMNFICWISRALFFVENLEKASFIEGERCWGAPTRSLLVDSRAPQWKLGTRIWIQPMGKRGGVELPIK